MTVDTNILIAYIKIESAEIADAMKKIYELAWAEAKRLDTKPRSTSV